MMLARTVLVADRLRISPVSSLAATDRAAAVAVAMRHGLLR